MTSYRLFFLNSVSAIAGAAVIVDADTDTAALQDADSLFRNKHARFTGFELWDRGRRVRRHVKA
jgi:hypothetical protein